MFVYFDLSIACRKICLTLLKGVQRLRGQPVAPQVGEVGVGVRSILVAQHREHELAAERLPQKRRDVGHGCQLPLQGGRAGLRRPVADPQKERINVNITM